MKAFMWLGLNARVWTDKGSKIFKMVSKQMKQRLENVPEHRRSIAEERITRLMQRSFQEGEKLERIEVLV